MSAATQQEIHVGDEFEVRIKITHSHGSDDYSSGFGGSDFVHNGSAKELLAAKRIERPLEVGDAVRTLNDTCATIVAVHGRDGETWAWVSHAASQTYGTWTLKSLRRA